MLEHRNIFMSTLNRRLLIGLMLMGISASSYAQKGAHLAMVCNSISGLVIRLDAVSTGVIDHAYSGDREIMTGTLSLGQVSVPVSVGYVLYIAADGSVDQVQVSLLGKGDVVLVGEVEGRAVFYGLEGVQEFPLVCQLLP